MYVDPCGRAHTIWAETPEFKKPCRYCGCGLHAIYVEPVQAQPKIRLAFTGFGTSIVNIQPNMFPVFFVWYFACICQPDFF